jgi:hypothetical protein
MNLKDYIDKARKNKMHRIWALQDAYDIRKYNKKQGVNEPRVISTILDDNRVSLEDCRLLNKAKRTMQAHIKLTKILTGED